MLFCCQSDSWNAITQEHLEEMSSLYAETSTEFKDKLIGFRRFNVNVTVTSQNTCLAKTQELGLGCMRHGCKLRVDQLAKAYNRERIIPVFNLWDKLNKNVLKVKSKHVSRKPNCCSAVYTVGLLYFGSTNIPIPTDTNQS